MPKHANGDSEITECIKHEYYLSVSAAADTELCVGVFEEIGVQCFFESENGTRVFPEEGGDNRNRGGECLPIINQSTERSGKNELSMSKLSLAEYPQRIDPRASIAFCLRR